jgi:hypothetical protein
MFIYRGMYLYFLFFVLKQRKETKENSRTKEWLRPFVRPTHRDSDFLESVYWFCSDSAILRFVLCGDTEGADFFAWFVYSICLVLVRRKRGAGRG